MLRLDLTNAKTFLPEDWLDSRLPGLEQARTMLAEHNGPGGDFTGWVTLPRDYDREELGRIKKAADKIRSDSQVLVVIGIGGAPLGAPAGLQLLRTAGPTAAANRTRGLFSRPPPSPPAPRDPLSPTRGDGVSA